MVGSKTYGVVVDSAWSVEIDTALTLFVQDKDPVRFAAAVVGGR